MRMVAMPNRLVLRPPVRTKSAFERTASLLAIVSPQSDSSSNSPLLESSSACCSSIDCAFPG